MNSAHPNYRVLIVEDDDNDFMMSERLLTRYVPNVSIVRAHDGAEALEFLKSVAIEQTPHVVISDLKMPKLGGIELCREIHENPKVRHLPLVVLTTSDEPREVEEAYAAGASAFMIKSVDYDVYQSELKAMCDFYFRVVRFPSPKPRMKS